MKMICPRCNSNSLFFFFNKKKRQEYALCKNCFRKAPSDTFCLEDDQFWNFLDNCIKEYKINKYLNS